MKYMKSFIWHARRGEVSWQFYGFRFLPWADHINGHDDFSGVDYSRIFAGWLFLQFNWTHV